MKILLTGATGGVGGTVAAALADTEHTLRILARDPERLAPRVRERSEVVTGSHLDPETAAGAARGCDLLFWMTPMAMDDDVATFNRAAARAATAAAREVHRTVDLSGAYCERPGYGLASHLRMIERALEDACGHVAHVRGGLFQSNFALQIESLRAGVVSFPVPGRAAAPFVAPSDLAAAVVTHLLDSTWSGRRAFVAVGPDRLRFADTARILTEALGDRLPHPLRYVEQDEAGLAALVEAGWPESFAREYATMYRAFARAFLHGDEPEGERFVGSTSLRAYAREELASQLEAQQATAVESLER